MIRRARHRSRISRALGTAAIAVASILVSCGPPLTEPATSNVSGTWFAAGPAAGFTNITVTLIQNPDGTISGTYSATSDPALKLCSSTSPCLVSNPIIGTNTVFQVFLDLIGSAQFTGQLLQGDKLKGAMSRIDVTQPIEFTKP